MHPSLPSGVSARETRHRELSVIFTDVTRAYLVGSDRLFFFSRRFRARNEETDGKRRLLVARFAINPFRCETFESKSKFHSGSAALSSVAASAAPLDIVLSQKYLKTGRTRHSAE